MKSTILICLIICCISDKAPAQKSLKYLNQEPPGLTPKVFAPDLVSLENQYEFGSVFTNDAKEIFYAVDIGGKTEIRYMKLKKNEWTRPEKLIFHEKYSYNDPFLSPDESKLFFISDMALDGLGEKKDYDIWYVERKGDHWSKPINTGRSINTDKNEYYISFSKNGTMYFSSNAEAAGENKRNFDIYFSIQEKERFLKPVKLSDSINTPGYEADVFIAYDESYIIFCGQLPHGYGKGDLYISFKKADGTWEKAKNMGKVINTTEHELCPFVSKDGKYLFYTSNQDIFWVDAKIINELR
jgi:hypothetical protein